MLNLSNGAFAQTVPVTMSSLEIAELTGKNHGDVLRDIRVVLEEAEIEESKFAGEYKTANFQMKPCYNLPRRECDLVISGDSVKYRLAIIDRWQFLESQKDEEIDDMLYISQMAMRVYENRKRTALLEAENAKLKTRVDIVEAKADAVLSQSGWYSILAFGKLHKISVTTSQASTYSRGVNKLCQRDGIERQSVSDPRFTSVFIYPEHLLSEYFISKGLMEL
jgi:phage regulator Rha-like protein